MTMLDLLLQDLRFAVRQLLKAPGFTTAAVLLLGLGIGANSAVFSVVSAVLLRPSGYAEPERLMDVYATSGPFRHGPFSYPDYVDLRDQNTVFSGVLAYRLGSLGFSRGDRTRAVWSEMVSGNYLGVLGVHPVLGRGFDPGQDDVRGAAPTAVLSHRFWSRDLGGDPGIVGRAIRLNGQPFTVIGIAPPGFRGAVRGLVPAVWVPFATTERLYGGSGVLDQRGNHGSFVKARLKDGVAVAQARTGLAIVSRRLQELYSSTNKGVEFVGVPSEGVILNPTIDGTIGVAALVLLAIPGLVVLITCANLATLMLARAAGRRREIAVRLALGAGRRRVAAQFIIESLLLAGCGGALGMVLATWLAGALVSFQPPIPLPLSLDVGIDVRVVLFTFTIALVTGVLFGLTPALKAGRADLTIDLREGSRGATQRSPLRSALVAAQLALSALMLVGAALLLRSLAGATRLDLGFNPEGAARLTIDPSQQGYDATKMEQFFTQLLARVTALPGVTVASFANRPPLNLNISTNQIVTEGAPVTGDTRPPEVQAALVGPDYFATIGARLVAGREFTDRDRSDQPLVVAINQAAAKLLWPNESALGKRLAVANADATPGSWREVVAVVRDVKVLTVGESPTPQIFFPLFQRPESFVTLIARTTGDPVTLMPLLRQTLRELDPDMDVIELGLLTDLVSAALFPARFTAGLLVVLGCFGLLIAAIGLYGVMAHGVAQRVRELGIRMALGAKGGDVIRLVVRQGMVLVLGGLLVGLVLAAGGTRLLAAWLYGVTPLDGISFTAAPLVLLVVGLLACVIPARRATRVNPVEALRSE